MCCASAARPIIGASSRAAARSTGISGHDASQVTRRCNDLAAGVGAGMIASEQFIGGAAMTFAIASGPCARCRTAPPGDASAQDFPNRPIRVDRAGRPAPASTPRALGRSGREASRPAASSSRTSPARASGSARRWRRRQRRTATRCCSPPPRRSRWSQHFPQKIDFDPASDFVRWSSRCYQPVLLIVRPSLGVKTVAEFVALRRRAIPASFVRRRRASAARCS